jgi:hypothetical protein
MNKAERIERLIKSNADILIKNPVELHVEAFELAHKVFIYTEKPCPEDSDKLRYASAYWVRIFNRRKGNITTPLVNFPVY